MARYILKRLLWMIVIVLGTAFVIFTILYFTPGDPARYMLGATARPAEIANLHHELGLDRPYLVQLGDFLYKSFIKLDFGNSWVFGTPVFDELMSRLPPSMPMIFMELRRIRLLPNIYLNQYRATTMRWLVIN